MPVWSSYLLSILVIGFLMGLWIAVQFAWRRVFPAAGEDEDVLANRKGCQGCHCIDQCQKEAPGYGLDID